MDIIKLQILTNRPDQRKVIADKFETIDYIRIEDPINDKEDLRSAFKDDKSNVVLIAERYHDSGYGASREITTYYPHKTVVILKGARNTPFDVRETLISGASDVLPHDADIQMLTDAIYHAHTENTAKQNVIKESHTRQRGDDGKVFTVFSTKGGVGKTFVSVNLAIAIVKQTKKKVVLLDLDLEGGGSSTAMNLSGVPTVTDAIADLYNVDTELMSTYLTEHKSGISVLPTSSDPNMGTMVNSEQVDIIIRTLRQMFDYVIVDMPGRFTETLNPAFTLAHMVLLVTTPEVLSLKNIRSALIVFKELGYPMHKIKTVLNKASRSGITRKNVEATLENNVIIEISDDGKRVTRSQNEGKPYILYFPRSGVSRSFNKSVEVLAKNEKKKKGRK